MGVSCFGEQKPADVLLPSPRRRPLRAGLKITDADYASAYFGVDATQSAASGLPVYDADGGLYSAGLWAAVVIPLDRSFRWTLVGIAGYDRLLGEVEDAPLIELRGDPNQVSVGLFLSRSFG